MWKKFRAWPWWGQALGWIVLPAVVFTVWVWQMRWPVWARIGLAAAAFLVWIPVMAAAAGGGGSSSPPAAEAAEVPPATTTATTTAPPEPVEYPALAARIGAAQTKVRSYQLKFEPRRQLPSDVRRALRSAERLLRDGTITASERRSAVASLALLRSAIASGQLQELVVEARAEARARKKARKAAAAAAAEAEQAAAANCNPNYTGCLKPGASDYDCEGGSGDGPYYTGMVEVIGYDEYGLDADDDGIGCE